MWKDEVKFVSKKTGNALTFRTETNKLNDNQMYWIKEMPWTMWYGTKKEVRNIIRDIKNNCKVL